MNGLKPRERELVIARVEAQWTTPEIAEHFEFKTVDGARMAVNRAMQRLARGNEVAGALARRCGGAASLQE